jgi:hypothetical protein
MSKQQPFLKGNDREPYQRAFSDAIASHTPEVLKRLDEVVLPKYKALPESLRDECQGGPILRHTRNVFADPPRVESVQLPAIGEWKNLKSLEAQYPEVNAFRTFLLKQWAEPFNLTDAWLLDMAMQTLHHWSLRDANANVETDGITRATFRGRSERLRWHCLVGPHLAALPSAESDVLFQDWGWVPEAESWPDFRKGVLRRFGAYLDEVYGPQMMALLEKRGWHEAPEIRKAEHYQWLAFYQVRKWSPARIAQRVVQQGGNDKIDESTILKAVQKTAQRVGLTLRPPKHQTGSRRKT